MKNKILALLVLIAVSGFTATAAEAHPYYGHPYYGHQYYHRNYYHGHWYTYYDSCPNNGGFFIHFNF